MKLSILVDYLNQLEQTQVADVQQSAIMEIQRSTLHTLDHLSRCIQTHTASKFFKASMHQLERDMVELVDQFKRVDRTVEDLKQHVRFTIHSMAYYARVDSARRFASGLERLAVLDKLQLNQDVHDLVKSQLAVKCNWQYPALIVRPAHEDFIEDMSASNPLYLVDVDQSLLQPAMARFNEIMQRRFSCYSIVEAPDRRMLTQLPADQMAMCFLYGFFNFRSIELVKQWISELWIVCRPGGRVVFTYNDCDTAHGVALYESGWMSYTPGHIIRDHARSLGFLIEQDTHPCQDVWLMELKKPGELTSLRATQNLARIVARSK